ncbi:M3 family metallopeptidase [Escherichia coli]
MNGKPALFTHDEVITLFHEFGSSYTPYADPHRNHRCIRDQWGAVGWMELASVLENWCWEPEALAFILRSL